MKSFILILLCFGFILTTNGQKLDYIQGEYIVQLKERIQPEELSFKSNFLHARTANTSWSPIKNAPFNLHVLTVDYTKHSDTEVMRALYQNDNVEYVQTNKIMQLRAEPNDEFFDRQWQYINDGSNGGTIDADIDADRAWDITTGGLTADGDEIVVLIIDDGYDIDHDDMVNNLWVNRGEIPGDSIDNDQNGYIDDINGWNQQNNSNDISRGGGHGTPVAGIIGAKGNNGIGVAGVNWDVKLMIVKQAGISEANVIEAYSYAYDKRKKYNETNGAEGDFVVATNASWGIDQGNPDDSPIWCDLYNIMGEEGILSCGATANENFNIDEIGDLPTGCSSDFLISVTNLNRNDTKVTSAGYGRVTIDLGAHGRDTYTVSRNNNYAGFGGTSGATPHVAGAVALMYSVPCPELITLSKSNPGLAARAVKEMILNTVDPVAELSDITTARGRLNLGNAVEEVNNLCNNNGNRFGFIVDNISPYSADISWNENKTGLQTDIRYRRFDDTQWIELLNVQSAVNLEDLDVCQQYEYQERTYIPGATNIPWSYSRYFETVGCCLVSTVEMIEVINGQAIITMTNQDMAIQNTIQYRKFGTTEWFTKVGSSEIIIDGIDDCELLEYRVNTLCNTFNTLSDTTAILNIGTPCGDCTANEYCEITNFDNSSEWINFISINDNIFTSGRNNEAYSQTTGGYIPKILVENDNILEYEPGYDGQAFAEFFKIYIDLDKNGDFDEVTELVYESDGTINSFTKDTLRVPDGVEAGLTRMRVMLHFGMAYEGPCANNERFGEVEDYCVQLSTLTSTVDPNTNNIDFKILPNISSGNFNIELSKDKIENGTISIIDIAGNQIYSTSNINTNRISIDGSNWAKGTYIVRLSTSGRVSTKKLILF